MADSDNSTSLPFVTHGRELRQKAHGEDRYQDADPALVLLQGWLRAQHVSHVLCRLQQRLERRLLDAPGSGAIDEKVGYSIACQAEVEATTAALKLQDKIPQVQARSLLGVVAKLEIIAGADRDIDDPTDFPWPHIASVLNDLKEIAGSLPLERPDRTVVQADCRRYQAMAADMIGLQRQAANRRFLATRLENGRAVTLGIRPEHLDEKEGVTLSLSVDVTERLGSTSYVHGALASGESVVAERREDQPGFGEMITLRFQPTRARVFDGEGSRIR
ncbi:TOBE domain-containing protein [Mesorhizobium caraganae]|uniref:TOBE domain-containing protein n=1 Tax=Mesorhizobium caraganae TaxID=483206 RepID=UPI001FE3EE9A|nr:TOBE domain-containing protein [Mesorhizobium caraganae]